MTDMDALLRDIFGVPVDGSNIKDDDVDDNAFADIGKSITNIPFAEKANEVRMKISSANNKESASSVTEGGNESESGTKQTSVARRSSPEVLVPSQSSENDQEVAVQSSVQRPVAEPEGSTENEDDIRSEPEQPSTGSGLLDLKEDADGWILSCSEKAFETFYVQKKTLLNSLLPGGKIPFVKYEKEIQQAFVETKNESQDTAISFQQIEMIQKWRNRVIQIGIEINSQYHSWKRAVPMMHGLLANVRYEKPAQKQEGLNFIHLRDMDFYLQKLESMHETIYEVIKNLDSAFNSVSRQVTLILPQREPDRYEQRPAANEDKPPFEVSDSRPVSNQKIKDQMKQFDIITDDMPVKNSSEKPIEPIKKGVKKIAWSEFSRKR